MGIPEHDQIEADLTPTCEHLERRKWLRVPDERHSRVWFSTPMLGAQRGEVREISLGGFAMTVTATSVPEVGERIVIGFGEWMIPATVQYVADSCGGFYRVGLAWVRPESSAVKTLLARCVEE